MAEMAHEVTVLEDVEQPARKGWPILAWPVILVIVGMIATSRGPRPADTDEDRLGELILTIQSRYLVGAAEFVSPGDLYKQVQAQSLNSGPVDRRLQFVVLAGELAGAGEALSQLKGLDAKLIERDVELTGTQLTLRNLLGRLYDQYAAQEFGAPSLESDDRELLRTELGWFGDLALAPAGGPDAAARERVLRSARRTFLVFLGALLTVGLLALTGLVGLIVSLILAASGHLRSELATRTPFGGVYAETFAVWLILFLAVSLAASLLPAGESRLLFQGTVLLLSLVALAWPVLRGVPWRKVREDIGWTSGRQPLLEPALGFGCYVIALPLMAIGLLLTIMLVNVRAGGGAVRPEDDFSPSALPAHPIVEQIIQMGWWGRIQLLLLASVVAPVLEETMFRGVLYRHLREATARAGTAVSVLVSGTVVSFLFAAVHPQGWMAIPPLMALAYAFTLAREWRGTLVPAMLAHGINNALVTLLVILLL